MLTKETLIANEALASLSEEQISAIETLSKNDEDVVIGNRFGEVYREMDKTIKEATGIERKGDEKTYVYLKRAAEEYANKYADYDSLKTKIVDLEKKVAEGGDEATKTQLASITKELATTKEQYSALKASFDTEKAKYEGSLHEYKINSEIARAKEGIAFKSGMNEMVLNTLVESAIAKLKAKNPSFEVRDGEERLIYHDENGSPLNNAENKLEPYTTKELLIKEFEAMDLLEKKNTKGAGGKGNISSKTSLGVSTQVEATDAITKILLAKGITRSSLDFQKEFDKLWKENEVQSLPLK